MKVKYIGLERFKINKDPILNILKAINSTYILTDRLGFRHGCIANTFFLNPTIAQHGSWSISLPVGRTFEQNLFKQILGPCMPQGCAMTDIFFGLTYQTRGSWSLLSDRLVSDDCGRETHSNEINLHNCKSRYSWHPRIWLTITYLYEVGRESHTIYFPEYVLHTFPLCFVGTTSIPDSENSKFH